jgi:hypothetical protein
MEVFRFSLWRKSQTDKFWWIARCLPLFTHDALLQNVAIPESVISIDAVAYDQPARDRFAATVVRELGLGSGLLFRGMRTCGRRRVWSTHIYMLSGVLRDFAEGDKLYLQVEY